MIAYALDVNFEVEHAAQTYDAAWVAKEARGEITRDELRIAANERWGVVKELQIKIRAVK